ncbi:MAG: type II toxin-antitoxin system VapB family antitoxin [bacterium]
MKRTNIVINEKLVEEGKKISGIRTTKELVDVSLREFIRRGKQKHILDLKGTVDWQGDIEKMRQTRGQE